MKYFIRSDSLGESTPYVFASYPSDSSVTADTHGPELTMLEMPSMPLTKTGIESLPRLPEGWREQFGEPILEIEAQKRINAVLPPLEQMSTLHELMSMILQHGSDISQWPESAKTRKAEIDDAWNYVREVRARMRAMRPLPVNPIHDEHWPIRIGKR